MLKSELEAIIASRTKIILSQFIGEPINYRTRRRMVMALSKDAFTKNISLDTLLENTLSSINV